MNWATRIAQAYTDWLQAANGGSPEERREALRDLHEVTGQALQDIDPELGEFLSSDLRFEGKPMAAEDYKRTCTRGQS